jgi:hypothetical protein
VYKDGSSFPCVWLTRSSLTIFVASVNARCKRGAGLTIPQLQVGVKLWSKVLAVVYKGVFAKLQARTLFGSSISGPSTTAEVKLYAVVCQQKGDEAIALDTVLFSPDEWVVVELAKDESEKVFSLPQNQGLREERNSGSEQNHDMTAQVLDLGMLRDRLNRPMIDVPLHVIPIPLHLVESWQTVELCRISDVMLVGNGEGISRLELPILASRQAQKQLRGTLLRHHSVVWLRHNTIARGAVDVPYFCICARSQEPPLQMSSDANLPSCRQKIFQFLKGPAGQYAFVSTNPCTVVQVVHKPVTRKEIAVLQHQALHSGFKKEAFDLAFSSFDECFQPLWGWLMTVCEKAARSVEERSEKASCSSTIDSTREQKREPLQLSGLSKKVEGGSHGENRRGDDIFGDTTPEFDQFQEGIFSERATSWMEKMARTYDLGSTSRTLLLYGIRGTGKRTMVHLLGNHLGAGVFPVCLGFDGHARLLIFFLIGEY